jgi:hypothetical protein
VKLKKYVHSYHSPAANERRKNFWFQRLKDLPPVQWEQLVKNYNSAVNNERASYRPRFSWTDENIERALDHTHGYTYSTIVNANDTAKLKQVSVKYATTSSIVVMGSFLMLMKSLFNTRDTFIISRLNGRFHPESHDIIGNLTCAVYSRIHEHTGTVAEAIKAMHNELLDSLDYAIYNPLLLRELPLTAHCHLCVNIITDDETENNAPANKLISTPIKTYFPLEVVAVLRRENITFNWIYNTCLFRSSMIRFIVQCHAGIIQRISNLCN